MLGPDFHWAADKLDPLGADGTFSHSNRTLQVALYVGRLGLWCNL